VADMYACGVIVNGRFRGASGNLRAEGEAMRRVAGDADAKGRRIAWATATGITVDRMWGPSRLCPVGNAGTIAEK